MQKTAIVVENDPNTALALSNAVTSLGFTVRTAASLKEAQILLRDNCPDVVLLDVSLPDGDGLELLSDSPNTAQTRFVVITGDSRQDVAVRSLRARAADFLVKPVTLAGLRSALAKPSSAANDDQLPASTHSPSNFGSQTLPTDSEVVSPAHAARERSDVLLTGQSNCVSDFNYAIQQLARVNTNVIVSGEPGVDKIAAAFALHRRTPSSGVVALIQCATGECSIDHQHFNGEFSEFLRWTFTANRKQKHVTLIMDDVEQLSEARQREILSYLTAQSIVDSQNTIAPRVVCIKRNPNTAGGGLAAQPQTDRQLDNLIPDLQLCLWQTRLAVPSLRQRRSDILPMSLKVLESINAQHKTVKYFSEQSCEKLQAYDWPGNMRELVNVITQAFQTSDTKIETDNLLPSVNDNEPMIRSAYALVGKTFWEVEKALLLATLDSHDGDKKTAAKVLGISLKTLYNRLKAYSVIY